MPDGGDSYCSAIWRYRDEKRNYGSQLLQLKNLYVYGMSLILAGEYSRIIPIGVIWCVFSICYSLLEKGFFGIPKSTRQQEISIRTFSLLQVLAFITGLLSGKFIHTYENPELD